MNQLAIGVLVKSKVFVLSTTVLRGTDKVVGVDTPVKML